MIRSDFTLFAHRGDNRNYTENTAKAFRSSIEKGYRAIELDLVRLVDGTVVVFHDDDLLRLCNDPRSIHEIRYPDFRSLFPDLLTFDELVDEFGKLDLTINLEIKDDAETVRRILPRLGEFRRPVISSFNTKAVHFAASRGCEVGYLFSNRFKYRLHRCFLKSGRLHLNSRLLLDARDPQRSFGRYDVYCYTVNDLEDAHRLIALPFVKGIFTDRSDLLEQL